MVEFRMYVGLSGSGKSTLAQDFITENRNPTREDKYRYLSSDRIREELYGDENCQDNPAAVFELMNQRTVDSLAAGVSVVYDATNLSAKRRKAFIRRIKQCVKHSVIFTAVVVACPLDTCIFQDKTRKRTVGTAVIMKQLAAFQIPTKHEGWDNIILEYTHDRATIEAHAGNYVMEAYEMQHENPHHNDTVFQHSVAVADIMQRDYEREEPLPFPEIVQFIRSIGLLHDIGKVCTKTYDENGIAHFYGHNSASAYLSLFFPAKFTTEQVLMRAAIIGWHMRHFSFQTEEGFNYWLLTLDAIESLLLKLLMSADQENSLPLSN